MDPKSNDKEAQPQDTKPKTEKEKMLAGELYLATDPELFAERRHARGLLCAYNQSPCDDPEARVRLLRQLLGAVGGHIEIEPPFYCDYGYNILAGENLYMNFGCVVLDCNRVVLGANVQCGPYVQIYTAHHPLDPRQRAEGPELASPVRIGNDVWIGGGAIICPGITIGDGTTIGAGSVVTRDIPARVVAAGNPCRVIRTLADCDH